MSQISSSKQDKLVIITAIVFVLVIAISGGVIAFSILNQQVRPFCETRNLVGTWQSTDGSDVIEITANTIRINNRGVIISGSYSCSGNTINWTLSNNEMTTLEILSQTNTTMQLKNALGIIADYQKQ